MRSAAYLFFLVAFAVTGCQKVNLQKTVELSPLDVVAPFIVDAPSSNQSIAVVVSSSAAPVDVFVVLEKDRDAAEKALANGGTPKDALASQLKVKNETTLTATVPAKNAYAVIVGNANVTTKVSLHIKTK